MAPLSPHSLCVVGLALVVGLAAVGCHAEPATDAGSAQPPACSGVGPHTSEEATVEHAREAARQRAERWLDLVEYAPATLGRSPALAIVSYPRAQGPMARRSFVYDDALALLWFAWNGQKRRAAGLAETLMYLQKADGSWGFSFATGPQGGYDASYVRSGTVAWAAHALGYYGERFSEPLAVRAAQRAATYLRELRLGEGRARGLVSAGTGSPNLPADAPAGAPLGYAVAEHQFDAYEVLARYDAMTAERMAERMLEVLWLDDQGRFGVAATAEHVDHKRALDAAGAWGALWLWSLGERARAQRSYAYTRRTFATDKAGLFGFRPYEDDIDGYDPTAHPGHIFVEGTMGMGLAAHRLGDEATARRVLATGIRLSCQGQAGLAYSNVKVRGFSTRPAAASTLWFLFLDREMATGMTAPLFDSGRMDSTG